jgi:hypothetical protein
LPHPPHLLYLLYLPYLPYLPHLPHLPYLPDLPDLPHLPHLPDLPDLPHLLYLPHSADLQPAARLVSPRLLPRPTVHPADLRPATPPASFMIVFHDHWNRLVHP